jgi:hypothetical protein
LVICDWPLRLMFSEIRRAASNKSVNQWSYLPVDIYTLPPCEQCGTSLVDERCSSTYDICQSGNERTRIMRAVALSTNKGSLRDILTPRSEPAGSGETASRALRSDYVTTEHGLGKQIEECVAKCLDCRSLCMKVVDHCWRLRKIKRECPDIRPLLNCAEMCATTARFMLRGSEFCRELCVLCAQVCQCCADQFRGVHDETEIEACAAACRQCAECCERIAGVATDISPLRGCAGR